MYLSSPHPAHGRTRPLCHKGHTWDIGLPCEGGLLPVENVLRRAGNRL